MGEEFASPAERQSRFPSLTALPLKQPEKPYPLHPKQIGVGRRAIDVLENLGACAPHERLWVLHPFVAYTSDEKTVEIDRIGRGNGIGHSSIDKT
jgi:hypothetical protein